MHIIGAVEQAVRVYLLGRSTRRVDTRRVDKAAVSDRLQAQLWSQLLVPNQAGQADTIQRCMISALSGCGFPNNSPDDRG